MCKLVDLIACAAICVTLAAPLPSQTPAPTPAATTADPLSSLDFLLGRWSAQSTGGAAQASSSGTYTFARDLNGHALQRTSTAAGPCTGPAGFDCKHRDQLTIFADPNGAAAHHATLFALFLDNEGHVIYYTIATPDPHTAVFDSQSPPGAPHFRLTYHLEGDAKAATMTGKFQMAAPGSSDFHSYLEWTGTRQ